LIAGLSAIKKERLCGAEFKRGRSGSAEPEFIALGMPVLFEAQSNQQQKGSRLCGAGSLSLWACRYCLRHNQNTLEWQLWQKGGSAATLDMVDFMS